MYEIEIFSQLIFHTCIQFFFFVLQQFQQQKFDIVMVITTFSVGLVNLLIYCYLGKSATESHGKMSDCIYYNIKWYKLSIELQKHFILMIKNMQKPIYYHGFGVIYLNLETFTKASVN